MNEEQLNALRRLDWDDIVGKVLAAAVVLAGRYGWTARSVLPNGSSLEDLVAESIRDLWADPVRINSNIGLTAQLKGMVRSKLWNLAKSSDERVHRSETLEQTASVPNVEASGVDTSDEFSRAIQLLLNHPKISGHSELELTVMALSCGALTGDEISAETSIPVKRVYQLTRELRELYPSIARKLQAEGQ